MRWLVALVALAAASPVRAQPGDVAAAETLFKEGMALMEAGKYAEACPKLAESQRLDPGVGTLFNLARCYEKTDRLASAWAKYLEASQEAERRGEPRRAAAAKRYAERLEPKLTRLVIGVPQASRIDGLVIKRDGAVVGAGSWGTKLPVDTGDVVIEVSAPGYVTWKTTVTITADKKLRLVEIPRLEVAPEPAPAPVVTVERIPGEPWYRDKLGWGLVAGGVIVAGGSTFALIRAGSLESDARAATDLGARDRLFDDGDSYRIAGISLAGAAAVLVAVGAVRLALAPSDSERRVERLADATGAALLLGRRSIAVRVRF